jgi:cellulose synthase (UDP-forming)
MTFLVAWLQAGGIRGSAIVTSIAASWVHARALGTVLLRRSAAWSPTNRARRSRGNLWSVLPHACLLVLNVAALAVGLIVPADPATTYLSCFWAGLNVLLLGRIVWEGVRPRRSPTVPAGTPTASFPMVGNVALELTSPRTAHSSGVPS